MVTKAQFNEQLERAKAREKELKAEGITEQNLAQALLDQGFWGPVVSKVTGISGRRLPKSRRRIPSDEEHEAKIREVPVSAKKPILEKEIENSAWFHNLIHDVGKHVYHSVTTHVRLDVEDLNDYEKARAKMLKYYDTLEELKDDALKILDTQAENAELEYALKVALKTLDKYKRFIQVVTASMDKESRIRALTAFVLSPDVVFKEAAS